MKRFLILVLFVVVFEVLLPLNASAASGVEFSAGKAVATNCKSIKKVSLRKACLLRAEAIAEEARRRAAAAKAQQRKVSIDANFRNIAAANILMDQTIGEDPEVRKAAVDALGNRAGTIVVMEAKTGKIVTMVNHDWAIRETFKPCSTIKLVTGVAGVAENVIDENGNIRNSTMPLVMKTAIVHSNNPFFQRAGKDLPKGKFSTYGRTLGLAQPTGINAKGEASGKLPTGNESGRTYSHGDGSEVTALQLAVLAVELTTGKKPVPYIPGALNDGTSVTPQLQEVKLSKEVLEAVVPGMKGAVDDGTARRLNDGLDSPINAAGKTGSCIDEGTWVGLLTSVAPVENPQYAVVVIYRGQGARGKYSAEMAGLVYKALAKKIVLGPPVVAEEKPRQSLQILQ